MKLYRSVLFMPGHRADLVDKGIASGADAIVLDLEDSVPEADKVEARSTVAESIDRVRAGGHEIGLLVRPNGLATKTTGSDLAAVVRPGLDGIFPPKIETPADVHRFDALLDHAEHVGGATGLEMMVPTETAMALQNVPDIASASGRIGAVVGATARRADIAREVGFEWTPEGQESLYIRSRVLLACRASRVHAITGLWEDVADLDGLHAFAQQGRTLGFRGMIAIHPTHVSTINDVFTPTQAQIDFHRGLVAAFEQAEADGRAALLYQGEHIDIAHAATSREFLATAESLTTDDPSEGTS
ncbi:MAG: HpcH/HpaI aldolase/citrate lyase family protein [Acidimicrobiales bacterium]